MPNDTPPRDPIIVCDHVCLAYGREEVVHDACLTIQPGSFLPFVGPNGAGKTTLLRAILGLLRPRKGRIVTPFHRCPPGYVPQQKSIDRLYPVSTRQIVAMGLYPQVGWWRRTTRSQQETVQRVLEHFNLAEHAKKTFGELSGGMRQKAMIARALAGGAEVFIMDEPTSELDEQSEKDLLGHLFRLSKEHGKTVLLAHHGLDHISELAPVLCLVKHGRVSMVKTEDVVSVRGEQNA
jgi:ABC-type Mn2+/Zn2+ transport system ATPase subunit